MMRRTILYVHPTSEIGGADVSLLELVAGLDGARFRRVVLLPAEGPLVGNLCRAGAEVRVLPCLKKLTSRRGRLYLARYGANYALAVRAVARLIRRESADLVHTNTLHCLYGFAAARLTRRPHVWHIREIVWQSRLLRRIETWLAAHCADRLVVPSLAVAAMFRDRQGLLPRQLVVVPNGVDTARFHPAQDGGRVRKELGVGSEEPLVGLVCRLDPWKGIETFLHAAAICRSRAAAGRFVIVGGPIDGHEGYLEALRAQARRLDLDGVVQFTGWRYGPAEMPHVMAALDLCVLASVQPEPFGRVVLEAMATGKPVVATALGGPLEICVPGETALLVPPGDPAAMAEAILTLLGDPGRARALGRAGRRRVEDRFEIGRMVQAIEALYEAVLDEEAAAAPVARPGCA